MSEVLDDGQIPGQRALINRCLPNIDEILKELSSEFTHGLEQNKYLLVKYIEDNSNE